MTYKRKRLFYFPVLYSLFSVFCILLFFIWPILNRQHYHAMEVNWYSKNLPEPYKWFYHIPKREYLDIIFTGDTVSDRTKINFGQLYMRQMITDKDTLHGINFHFSRQCHYATIVEVLDICTIEEAQTFAASDDGIKVFVVYKYHSKGGYLIPSFLRM